MRHLVAREVERLLTHDLGDALLEREVRRLPTREEGRTFGQEVDEVVT